MRAVSRGDSRRSRGPDDRRLRDRDERRQVGRRFARMPDGRSCITVSHSRGVSWACHSSLRREAGNLSV